MRLFSSLLVALTLSLSHATDVATEEKQNNAGVLDHDHDHDHHHHHHHHDHRHLKGGKDSDSHALCGTPESNMREVKVVDEALSEWLKKNGKAPLMTESHLTTIETHWHSIGRSDATGAITGTAITNTIAHLNNVYAASGFYFDLTRIDQTNNDLYYSGAGFDNRVDFNMKASTRSGNQAVLNIWSVGRTENFVVEYATYPWNYESDPIRDGVVFEIGAATGGSYADFNEGDVLVHAVGHWLGLLHPFENQCLPPGDFVEDTPPQSEPVYGCPLVAPTNPCGGASNYQNFMDFTDDACKFFFTLGQAERMAIAWDIYRAPGLLPNTPTVAPVTLFPTPGSALTPGQGCLSATPVSTSATISSTTVGAPAYETTACGSTFDVISPGVWYKVTGDGRTLSASTCSNTNYDSMISVYAATSCSQLTCITGNDDFCGLQSAVEWVGLAGVDYLIYVHGYNGIEGPFQLVISPTSLPAPTNPPAPTPAPTLPPTLDSNVLPLEAGCAVTSAISVGSTVSSSTVGAPRYQSRACGTIPAEVSAGVWYKATGTGGVLTASTCDFEGYDTMISVWMGPCAEGLTCVGGNDDACGDLQSSVSWNSMAGVDYYIFVHGYRGRTGSFQLKLASGGVVPTSPPTSAPTFGGPVFPFEQACSAATGLTIGGPTVTATTVGTPRYQTKQCGTAYEVVSRGLWYKVTGDGGNLVASLCGTSNFDTMLSVWQGPCSQLTCVVGIDDFCNLESAVEWSSTHGQEYYIFVHGFSGQAGSFGISVSQGTLPPITAPPSTVPPTTPVGSLLTGCQSATAVVTGSVITDTTVAKNQYHVPGCGSALETTSPGMWYKVQGNGASITASLCGNVDYFDSMLSVWRVNGDCNNVVCVTGNDDSCALSSEVTFSTEAGITYLIYVHGFLGGAGAYQLAITTDFVAPSPTPQPTVGATPPPTMEPTSDCIFGFALLDRAVGFFGFGG